MYSLPVELSLVLTEVRRISPSMHTLYIVLFTIIWWYKTYKEGRKEGNVLFNDGLNTCFIYGYMASDIW